MTAMRRRLAALAVLAAVGLAWLAGPAPARAGAPSGACPTASDGVTVVVDFGAFEGGVEVRCVPGSPASGLAALQGAGFGYSFVPGQPGLVCRIDDLPDPCNRAPTNAYWAYWHAPRGGSWAYSSHGAGSRTPPVGTVEGWAFGAAAQPSIAPPPAPPTTTTTTTTTSAQRTTTTTSAPAAAGAPEGPGGTAGPGPAPPGPVPVPEQPAPGGPPATEPGGRAPSPERAGEDEAAPGSPPSTIAREATDQRAPDGGAGSLEEARAATGSAGTGARAAGPAREAGSVPAGLVLGLGLIAAIGLFATRRARAGGRGGGGDGGDVA